MKLTEEQLKGVITLQEEFMKIHSNWRKGQSFFNALYILYPDVGDAVRGTSVDPYHRDEKIEDCINFLIKKE